MSTPTLPVTLAALARAFPERVRLGGPELDDTGQGQSGYWVHLPDCRAFVGEGRHASDTVYLLMALALEFEARGWILELWGPAER